MLVSRKFVAMLITLLLCSHSYAAENPWFGIWKLNREKSSMIGDTYTITGTGARYREDNGVQEFDFSDDGRDYAVTPGRTISVRSVGDRQWLEIRKTDGTETSRTTVSLSADQRTLTRHTEGTMPDGTRYSRNVVDRRMGTGNGLIGTWKTYKDSSSEPETLIYSNAGNGAMRMESVERTSASVTHFDGRPSDALLPNLSPQQTLAIKASSPTSYHWVLSIEGKPIAEGENTLAADRNSFTEVNWLVGKPSERYTMIYERQK